MKITVSDYPVLDRIKSKVLGGIELYRGDASAIDQMEGFAKLWAKSSLGINNQIYYLSDSFVAAYEAEGDEIFNSYPYPLVEDDNICFLHSNKMATCLNIRHQLDRKIIACSVFCFNGKIITTVGEYEINYSDEQNLVRVFEGWQSNNINNVEANLFNCILITIFIKDHKVKAAKIRPGASEGPHNNQSPMPVVILACE